MNLYKYNNFLLERNDNQILDLILESKMVFSKNFLQLIDDIDSPIVDMITRLNNVDVDINTNYIDISPGKEDMVLFKPDDKVEKVDLYEIIYRDIYFHLDAKLGLSGGDFSQFKFKIVKDVDRDISYFNNLCIVEWTDKDGEIKQAVTNKNSIRKVLNGIKDNEIKIGKFVRGLLTKSDEKFTDRDIEDFVNKYKSIIQISDDTTFSRFKEVSGDEIREFYSEDSYDKYQGVLGNSCMRYDKCQDYFDIYTENPNQVSLIILFSKKDNGKICGRAILWTDEDGDKLMDRVYYLNDSDREYFKSYARFKGYIDVYDLNDERCIKLEYRGLNQYPYMDTFKFYNEEDNTLRNTSNFDYNYKLESIKGGDCSCIGCEGTGISDCGRCDGDKTIRCGECYGDGTIGCDDCEGYGYMKCEKCDGKGCDDCEDGTVECGACSGNGTTRCGRCDGDEEVECDECDGEGEVECQDC